jgi:SNF2 family DNA or RNA helicase
MECAGFRNVKDARTCSDYVCVICRALARYRTPPRVKTTLIVCPTTIRDQWMEEIAQHTRAGAVKVRRWKKKEEEEEEEEEDGDDDKKGR